MNPIDENYKMPAEWAEHERTFISWPVKASMVYPEDYEAICRGYTDIIKALAEFEPVTVIVNPEELEKLTLSLANERINCLAIAHNDAWLRDNGPTFLIREDGNLAGVNWRFNAWGGKYASWELDDAVAGQLLKYYGVRQFDAPLIMEGGSVHVDGEGTLLTTEECLLNPNRNRTMTRDELETTLKKYLNIEKIIWLKRGLSGDETDGHVDNIACFAAPGKILLQVCQDSEDENYDITQENIRILQSETDAQGRKLEVIPIQQPPQRVENGKRLTLSYLNFYFVNGGIILPVFSGTAETTDRMAVQVLKGVFPDRKIRTVNGMTIIREGGNVHCTTQQMPAAKCR